MSRELVLYQLPFEKSWLRLNLNCNYEFEIFVFNWKCRSWFNLLADENENHTFMLINCWIVDHVWFFFVNKTFLWFKYVCIKKWTYKISARFHGLTEMSRDRNDQDRKVPWPKRLRSNRPDRKAVYSAPATVPRGNADMKINETNDIYVSLFTGV